MKILYLTSMVVMLSLSSCYTSYHTYLVAESPELKSDMYAGFVDDYDSVRVTFMFVGRPMNFLITVENLTNKPLYLDWNKTAFVVDGQLRTVSNPIDLVDITRTHTSYWDGDMVVIAQTTEARELPLKFIPSHTKFTFKVRSFSEWAPDITVREKMPKTKLHPEKRGDEGRLYLEPEKNLPSVRAVLSMHFENNRHASLSVDRSFYMTKQYKIKTNWDTNPKQPRRDRGYYVHRQSNGAVAGIGMAIVFGVVMVLISR